MRVLSNSPSRPVGFSGAKNRWGRNQSLLSFSATFAVVALPKVDIVSECVGVQSISSSFRFFSRRAGVWGMAEGPCKEGMPKTGFECAIMGLDDRDRACKVSSSIDDGNLGLVGVVSRETGFGVADREVSKVWAWVSTRRIDGGCCIRST